MNYILGGNGNALSLFGLTKTVCTLGKEVYALFSDFKTYRRKMKAMTITMRLTVLLCTRNRVYVTGRIVNISVLWFSLS